MLTMPCYSIYYKYYDRSCKVLVHYQQSDILKLIATEYLISYGDNE